MHYGKSLLRSFVFHAEDGIRYAPLVTGVQTCALPISACGWTAQIAQPHPHPHRCGRKPSHLWEGPEPCGASSTHCWLWWVSRFLPPLSCLSASASCSRRAARSFSAHGGRVRTACRSRSSNFVRVVTHASRHTRKR